jgi:hypothetical protein
MSAGFGLLAEEVVTSAAHVLRIVLLVFVRTGSDELGLDLHGCWKGKSIRLRPELLQHRGCPLLRGQDEHWP